VIGMFLNTDKAMLTVPGPRRSGRVRDTLPNVNGGGCVNAEISKYRFSRSSTDPDSLALWPVLLGRQPPP
jgi:hypothetical protein